MSARRMLAAELKAVRDHLVAASSTVEAIADTAIELGLRLGHRVRHDVTSSGLDNVASIGAEPSASPASATAGDDKLLTGSHQMADLRTATAASRQRVTEPTTEDGRLARMRTRRASHWLAILTLILAGCQAGVAGSPTATAPSPASSTPSLPPATSSGPTDGAEKLAIDLQAAGAQARIGELFAGDPFEAQGGVLCVGTEPVQLYVFGSAAAREEAARRIDPTNPSDMGTSMVDWNGRPRLWQRDRVIVAYLGEDAATEALLRSVLGEPFASGQGRPPLPGPNTCG